MQIVTNYITLSELERMSKKMFHDLVKAVIDIEQEIMVVDADFHADEESLLLEEHESEQENLWGINLHPSKFGTEDFLEFDSMINIRPNQGNMNRYVNDPLVRNKIKAIVKKMVKP